MKTEKCEFCGEWAEPPFKMIVRWNAPATPDDVPNFFDGKECDVVHIERPVCRYCAYAQKCGDDGLSEEGKDALDQSDED